MIDATFTSKLSADLSAASTAFSLQSGMADLSSYVAGPNHVFIEIYTASGSEIVVAFAGEDGAVKLQRGMGGTTPRSHPAGACLRVTQLVDGPLCGTGDSSETGSGGDCDCPTVDDLLGLLVAGKGISIDLNTRTISLSPTGAVAGDYGGAEINECGQFTNVPSDWPARVCPTGGCNC